MAKMTKEEKKAKAEAKKAAAKAKREAKKAARLERLEKRREKKRLAREAKKARTLAKREKMKAKKAKEKERVKLLKAKEKARAQKLAKKIKNDKKPVTDAVDIRSAAKIMKVVLADLAKTMASYEPDKRIKKAKAIHGLGYDVETIDGNVVVRFIVEKSKKSKTIVNKPAIDTAKRVEPIDGIDDAIDGNNASEPEVELVPAGDLYGQNGNVDGEVANIDDDNAVDDESEEEDADPEDDFIRDSRDEQDDDLVDSRREFFGNVDDDGEMNDE